MGVKVTVNSVPKNRISINSQQRQVVRTVNVIPPAAFEGRELRNLNDVDASDLDNNEVLVYDDATDKFVIKELPIVNGGTF